MFYSFDRYHFSRLLFIYLFICLPVYLFIYLLIYLFIYLPVHLPVYLCVYIKLVLKLTFSTFLVYTILIFSICFWYLGAKKWQKISENRMQYFGNENFVNILTSLKVRPQALEKGESSTKIM